MPMYISGQEYRARDIDEYLFFRFFHYFSDVSFTFCSCSSCRPPIYGRANSTDTIKCLALVTDTRWSQDFSHLGVRMACSKKVVKEICAGNEKVGDLVWTQTYHGWSIVLCQCWSVRNTKLNPFSFRLFLDSDRSGNIYYLMKIAIDSNFLPLKLLSI